MKVLVTGGSGLIGSYVIRELERRKHVAVCLSRPQFKLGNAVDPETLRGCEGLVHCAYDFDAFGWSQIKRVNVDGSIALIKAAVDAGATRVVFVSSIAAFDGCTSLYGRGKLEVENFVRAIGAATIRPGLIFGDPELRGMFGALARIVRLPVVPVFGGGLQEFYLAHVADVATALVDALERYPSYQGKTVLAANSAPIAFRRLLVEIARRYARRTPSIVSVPAALALYGLKGLEAVGLRPRFRSDSLVSMMTYDRHPDFAATRELRLQFRPFP